MSEADHSSLISFLAAPVLVVDPEGHIIYANPAFQRRFTEEDHRLQGENLAMVFAGGGREAVLQAVAKVCQSGGEEKFRLMEGGRGYLAVASPIESETDRVGVMVLLTDEPNSDRRLLTFHGQIRDPLDEATAIFEDLFEQTGGRRAEAYRDLVERGLQSLERVRKWTDELHGALLGRKSTARESSFDPGRVVRAVVGALESEFAGAGMSLGVLMPAQLPALQGDAALFESALMQLLRHRLGEASSGGSVIVSARPLGEKVVKSVLVSVVDSGLTGSSEGKDVVRPSSAELRVVQEATMALGGRIGALVEAEAGRVVSLWLHTAS